MPRKNDRVRERHVPKAAQPQRGERRTPRAQFVVDEPGVPRLMPSRAKWKEVESALVMADLSSSL